mmetsp:Transcript_12513/g.18897  ORF Transcript_12513/g.18897 Transcript_12513/m.18897 type:complete len:80 (-) Transcript_12513:565-804(-)
MTAPKENKSTAGPWSAMQSSGALEVSVSFSCTGSSLGSTIPSLVRGTLAGLVKPTTFILLWSLKVAKDASIMLVVEMLR